MSANDTGDRRRPAPRGPVVTLAALYGAGGSVVGPQVAQRLGVDFLDREVLGDVARRTGLSAEAVGDAVGDVDEPRSRAGQLIETLARAANLSGAATGPSERPGLQEHQLRDYVEQAMARLSASGGVAIGRGGMVVLADVPGVLHVHLGGPRDARIRQRMGLEGLDRKTAEQRQQTEDRTRIRYVRDAYGVDGEDPRLYHLMIDSTALDLDTCVDLIVAASRARTRQVGAGPTSPQPQART